MTLVVIVEAVVIALLLILVAGLLKSHADILRQLDVLNRNLESRTPDRPRLSGLGTAPMADLVGVDPTGRSVSLSLQSGRTDTLLAFLSSGCSSCMVFWDELGNAESTGQIAARSVVVTKGPEHESPQKITGLVPDDISVVMSDQVWDEFRVPITPYFVLVSRSGDILGEGSATSLTHLADLFSQSASDAQPLKLDTKERADRVDEELRDSGVEPGDSSLYQDPLRQ